MSSRMDSRISADTPFWDRLANVISTDVQDELRVQAYRHLNQLLEKENKVRERNNQVPLKQLPQHAKKLQVKKEELAKEKLKELGVPLIADREPSVVHQMNGPNYGNLALGGVNTTQEISNNAKTKEDSNARAAAARSTQFSAMSDSTTQSLSVAAPATTTSTTTTPTNGSPTTCASTSTTLPLAASQPIETAVTRTAPAPPTAPFVLGPAGAADSQPSETCWLSCLDPQGKEFFYNNATKVSSWEVPAEGVVLPPGVTYVETLWGSIRSDVVYGLVGKKQYYVPLLLRLQTELAWKSYKVNMRQQLEAIFRKPPYSMNKKWKLVQCIADMETRVPVATILQLRQIKKATNDNVHYKKTSPEERRDDEEEKEEEYDDEEEEDVPLTNEQLFRLHHLVVGALLVSQMPPKNVWDKPPKQTRRSRRSITSSPGGSQSGLDTIDPYSPRTSSPSPAHSFRSPGRGQGGLPPRTPQNIGSRGGMPRDISMPIPNSSNTQLTPALSDPWTSSARRPSPPSSSRTHKRKVCDFYPSRCKFGDHCRFLHDKGDGTDVRDQKQARQSYT